MPTKPVIYNKVLSKTMHTEKANIPIRRTTQHWLRDSLTCLIESFIWAGCLYIEAQATDHKYGQWYIHVLLGFILLIFVTRFFPNIVYSRTARRDEVMACAMKTALIVCILSVAIPYCHSFRFIAWLFFCIALTLERLILNSWFIRYCTRPAHCEHAVLFCSEEEKWQQRALQQNTYGLKVTRLEEPIVQQLLAYLPEHPEIESIYYVPSAIQTTELETVAHICSEHGITLHLLPQPVCALNLKMESECRGTINVLSPAKLPLQSFTNRLVKRLTDIMLSTLILLTIFPLFALIAYICIKRQSHGPVLVTRHMCGMNGKLFQSLTFRTRHYEAAPSFLDGINDPGYFPFGKFLTGSKLELLPQFLCVLWGSMTIVGSQTMRPDQYTDYRRELKQDFASDYYLKAGITNYHFPTQAKGSTKADIWYYRNWGFWLDLRIILQRISTLLNKSRANTIDYI